MKIKIGDKEWEMVCHEVYGINSKQGAEIFQAVADELERQAQHTEGLRLEVLSWVKDTASLKKRVETLERHLYPLGQWARRSDLPRPATTIKVPEGCVRVRVDGVPYDYPTTGRSMSPQEVVKMFGLPDNPRPGEDTGPPEEPLFTEGDVKAMRAMADWHDPKVGYYCVNDLADRIEKWLEGQR
jgi:hypothetical protein